MDFYVYAHRKATTGQIFYIGKGSGNRAFADAGRTDYWRRTVKKHGLIVEIVQDGLQEWYAHELECELIALHGRRNLGQGPLVNLTDGGEGTIGRVMTDQQRAKNAEQMRMMAKNPQVRAKIKVTLKQIANDSAWRKKNAEQLLKLHQDQNWITRLANLNRQRAKDPEWLAKNAEKWRKLAQDPGYRAKHAEAMRRLTESPEWRVKNAEATRKLSANPEWRSKQADACRKRSQTPEWQAKHAQASRKLWQDPGFRAKNAEAVRKTKAKPILCVETGAHFAAGVDAVAWLRENGYPKATHGNIGMAAQGKRPKAYGHTWRYADANVNTSPIAQNAAVLVESADKTPLR